MPKAKKTYQLVTSRLYVVIIFLVMALISKAQVVDVYTGTYKKRKKIEKSIKKDLKEKNIVTSTFKPTKDSIYVSLSNLKESLTMVLGFDTLWDMCTYQEIIFDCSECAYKYLDAILQSSLYKFKKIEENKYMSCKLFQTEMTVIKNPGNDQCLKFIFKYYEMGTKQYDAWYKSLPATK